MGKRILVATLLAVFLVSICAVAYSQTNSVNDYTTCKNCHTWNKKGHQATKDINTCWQCHDPGMKKEVVWWTDEEIDGETCYVCHSDNKKGHQTTKTTDCVNCHGYNAKQPAHHKF